MCVHRDNFLYWSSDRAFDTIIIFCEWKVGNKEGRGEGEVTSSEMFMLGMAEVACEKKTLFSCKRQ